jgi:hypothetical protein
LIADHFRFRWLRILPYGLSAECGDCRSTMGGWAPSLPEFASDQSHCLIQVLP